MMHTRPLYYEEPYRRSHTAHVLAIRPDGVILNETICYPEGGGQSGDRGTIGGCILEDTVYGEGGVILHKVVEPTFSIGERVTIELDWDHRFHYMQMHTAQHLGSGLLHTEFSIGTVSVHQGQQILTIETDATEIPLDTCYALEDLVNLHIREAHPLHYKQVRHEEALQLPLRRSVKVDSEEVRLVEIKDIDVIACGGIHLANTSEIVLFQYEGQEKLRGRIRLIFTVGNEALTRIRENRSLVDELCTLHSAQRETLLATEQYFFQQVGKERQLLAQRTERLAALKLENLIAQAPLHKGVPVVLWEIDEDVEMKQVGVAFSQIADLALCCAKMEQGKLLWLVGLAGKAADLMDFQTVRADLLGSIQGKGGGRAPLYQGVGSGQVEDFFQAFTKAIYG